MARPGASGESRYVAEEHSMSGKRGRCRGRFDPIPIELQPSGCQLSKAGMEGVDSICLPVTPLRLAGAVVRGVEINQPSGLAA